MTSHHDFFNEHRQRPGLWAAALFLFSSLLSAQQQDVVTSVEFPAAAASRPLAVSAHIVHAEAYSAVELVYRPFGTAVYKHLEMQLANGIASAMLPGGDVFPPYVEYYLLFTEAAGGARSTYPWDNAELQPLKIFVPDEEPTGALVILSPEEGETSRPDEVLVSFSLFRADSTIDRNATKLMFDGKDVSSQLVRTDDLFVFLPDRQSLTQANHTVSIALVDTSGRVVHTVARSFNVGPPGGAGPAAVGGIWNSTGLLQLETRNENIGGSVQPYNRASLNLSGTNGTYRFDGRLFLTNEEKEFRQPQHRFFAGVSSSWFRAGYGDQTPSFPSLIMDGKRVRGFAGNLLFGFVNLDVATGQTIRSIEGDTLKTFPTDSLAGEQSRDTTHPFGPYGTGWAKYRYGTFSRNILVVRPSFGSKERGQWGFTYLKSKDDAGSILYGIRPEENLVVGSDLSIVFDRRNVELSGQVAFSATNKDIAKGTLTDTDIDSIFKDPDYSDSDRDNIRKARDVLQKFMTVNENIVPLSFKNLSTLSYEAGITLNYFQNAFRYNYIRHGNSYESFGQTFLRSDVVGYQVSDRLRLADNRVYLSGGYERLSDNTAETKATRTTYSTLTTAVSYLSRTEFPNFTLGFSRTANENGRTDSIYAVNDGTNRFFVQLNRTFRGAAQHDLSIGFSTSQHDDQAPRNLDSKTTSLVLSDAAAFSSPLRAVVSVAYNSNEYATPVPGGAATSSRSYTTVFATAEYRAMESKLVLFGTASPTFGDIERTIVEGGARYQFTRAVSGSTQLSRYFNKVVDNDLIWSLILRVDM